MSSVKKNGSKSQFAVKTSLLVFPVLTEPTLILNSMNKMHMSGSGFQDETNTLVLFVYLGLASVLRCLYILTVAGFTKQSSPVPCKSNSDITRSNKFQKLTLSCTIYVQPPFIYGGEK